MINSAIHSKPDFLLVLVIAVFLGLLATLTVQARAEGWFHEVPSLASLLGSIGDAKSRLSR